MNNKAIPDFSHQESEMTYSTETSEEPAVNKDAREKPVIKDRYGYEKLIPPQAAPREFTIPWNNFTLFTYLHLAAFYAIYLCFTGSVKLVSVFFYIFLYISSAIGTTANRLWTHKAYKDKLPLEIILMLLNSLAFENTALYWCRDHKMHHKYKKYAIPVIGTICFFLPTVIPMYFWGETLISAWHLNMLRYIGAMHFAFCVDSVVHIWGYKPYDVNISLGRGFHNFHQVFPWDYRTSEFEDYLNASFS